MQVKRFVLDERVKAAIKQIQTVLDRCYFRIIALYTLTAITHFSEREFSLPEGIDHQYEDKYKLAESLTNMLIGASRTTLMELGFLTAI